MAVIPELLSPPRAVSSYGVGSRYRGCVRRRNGLKGDLAGRLERHGLDGLDPGALVFFSYGQMSVERRIRVFLRPSVAISTTKTHRIGATTVPASASICKLLEDERTKCQATYKYHIGVCSIPCPPSRPVKKKEVINRKRSQDVGMKTHRGHSP